MPLRPRSASGTTRLLAFALLAVASLLAFAPARARAGALTGSPFAAQPAEALVPYVIGGQQVAIGQVPYQVYVVAEEADEHISSCGGAILSDITVVTAAHCVTLSDTTTPIPSGNVIVVAGADEIMFAKHEALPRTSEEDTVKNVQVDPLYDAEAGHLKDDVALLTLRNPLSLSMIGPESIPLVDAGETPAPGTALTVSGYGREDGEETTLNVPNGRLYSAALTAVSSDACRDYVGVNSAVLLCADSSTSATCEGDSGGPLTEGNPPVLVGIVDSGLPGCPPGKPDLFTNLAAGEVHAFVEGESTIPTAARYTTLPTIKAVGANPVDYSPLACEPGAWSEAASFTYTFLLEAEAPKLLQSGTSNLFTPTSALVGDPLVCVVQATNAGGTSTARSATTAPVEADQSAPEASIASHPSCHRQTCTLAIDASDPNDDAITLRASASFHVAAACSAAKAHRRRRRCAKKKTIRMALARESAGLYEASTSGLPYDERISFDVLVSDAADLAATPARASITLTRPRSARRGFRLAHAGALLGGMALGGW